MTTARAIRTESGIRVVIGQEASWTPTGQSSGNQGVGIGGGGSGYAITQAQLATGDYTAPSNVTGLTGQGTPMQADLSWTGASDNAGGSGLLRYNVYRNSVLIGSTYGTTYTDSAVSPGTTYTYTVRTKPLRRRALTRGYRGGARRFRGLVWVTRKGGPCDPTTQIDAGRTPAS